MRSRSRRASPKEPIEQPWQIVRSHAASRVDDVQFRGMLVQPQANAHLALKGKLESVRHEVEDDLFPHVCVDIDRLGQCRAVDGQGDAGPLEGGTKHTRKVGCERREIGRLV